MRDPLSSPQGVGVPLKASLSHVERLVGCKNFQRHNPKSDLFTTHRFHHVEFWCPDAMNAHKRFQCGLGMRLVARSDQSTGNNLFASYIVQSHDLVFGFTSPQPKFLAEKHVGGDFGFDDEACREFIAQQGLGVRALGLLVEDATEAFEKAVARGAEAVAAPRTMVDEVTGTSQTLSEIGLYGHAVLRFVSGDFSKPYPIEGYEPVTGGSTVSFGLRRLDHAVGNVHDLLQTVNNIMAFTGFHEFAEFTAEDVGTVESGLNSMVLANNNQTVLLPINEPTTGTKRQSQIQTYLDFNGGPGVQHLALKTDDIIFTLTEMRKTSEMGGFDLMERPSQQYYQNLPERIGNVLTEQQYEDIEKLGILADKDDQGVLLQIFTKPIAERPTIFLEIIQRVGCEVRVTDENGREKLEQAGGCGGFGKGNFSELFKSIEEYEKTLGV